METLYRHSDGCAAQYKYKNAFRDIAFLAAEEGISVEQNLFETSHGKGPHDGLGAATDRGILHRKVSVGCAEDMVNYQTEQFGENWIFIQLTQEES